MKTIVFTDQAARELDALSESVRNRIMSALVDYAVAGDGDVKRLSGRDGFRLRVGNYRVLFSDSATIK